MRIEWKGSLRKVGDKRNPSMGITIPKERLRGTSMRFGRQYTFIVCDGDVEKAQSAVIDQNRAEIEMLKKNSDALHIAISNLSMEVRECRKRLGLSG